MLLYTVIISYIQLYTVYTVIYSIHCCLLLLFFLTFLSVGFFVFEVLSTERLLS